MQKKKYLVLLLFLFSLQFLFGQIIDSSKLVLSNKVLFDFGEYELTPIADSILTNMVAQVKPLKRYTINITAHTDAIGSLEANQQLSENRAEAVKNLFVTQGLAIENINIQVFGEEKPTSSNDTDNGRQLNRRATIEVFEVLKLLPFKGQIKDDQTGEAIPANIVIRTKDHKDSLQTDSVGM